MPARDVCLPPTNWTVMLLPAVVPLVVAASLLAVAAAEPPVDGKQLATGLVTVLVVQLVGALALGMLARAFDTATRSAALRRFLAGYALLVGIVSLVALSPNHGDWRPRFDTIDWRLYAINVLVLAVDAAIAIAYFRGDPRREGARLEAAADDLYDLCFLTLQALFLVFAAFLVCVGMRPDEYPRGTRAVFLGVVAAAFVAKAVILTYVRTGRFAASGQRLLGRVSLDISRSRAEAKERAGRRRDAERERAELRRAVLQDGEATRCARGEQS